jgi:hypothetical protein
MESLSEAVRSTEKIQRRSTEDYSTDPRELFESLQNLKNSNTEHHKRIHAILDAMTAVIVSLISSHSTLFLSCKSDSS